LWKGFTPIISRELPFAVTKFLVFDRIASFLIEIANTYGSNPVQVGVGLTGLSISALSGALAGVAGAVVSHPADLVLTLNSASSKKDAGANETVSTNEPNLLESLLEIVEEGGITNLFVGLQARSVFFFLVIGLQFLLYDYVKTLLNVGSDDLTLVLDVFYAVRLGFLDMDT